MVFPSLYATCDAFVKTMICDLENVLFIVMVFHIAFLVIRNSVHRKKKRIQHGFMLMSSLVTLFSNIFKLMA